MVYKEPAIRMAGLNAMFREAVVLPDASRARWAHWR